MKLLARTFALFAILCSAFSIDNKSNNQEPHPYITEPPENNEGQTEHHHHERVPTFNEVKDEIYQEVEKKLEEDMANIENQMKNVVFEQAEEIKKKAQEQFEELFQGGLQIDDNKVVQLGKVVASDLYNLHKGEIMGQVQNILSGFRADLASKDLRKGPSSYAAVAPEVTTTVINGETMTVPARPKKEQACCGRCQML